MLDCGHFAAQHLNPQELAKKYSPRRRPNTTLARTAYIGGEEAKGAVMQYVKGALRIGAPEELEMAWLTSDGKNLARIFATIGQMGKGKTRLQYELCEQDAIRTDFGATHVNFVRLTYNEGFQADALPGRTPTVFAQNLLLCTGMGLADAQRVLSLEEAIELLYRKLTWPAGKTQALVVCVDEFLTLPTGEDHPDPDAARAALLRELVRFQERTCLSKEEQPNRVVFIFSAVTEELVTAAAEVSGRQLRMHDVPTLSKEHALSLLFELRPDLRARYEGGSDPQFEQLVHLCLARPRALFNGILKAYPPGVGSVDMTSALNEVAQSNSVNDALRHLGEEDVRSWLASMSLCGNAERKELQKQWGVTTAAGCLDPLTLRVWCEKETNWSTIPVAWHLREAYMADTKVHHEKDAEDVLYNFEAAKRASYGRPFCLGEYYAGGSGKGGLEAATVRAFPGESPPVDLVARVQCFKDAKDTVFERLQLGCIVVSTLPNEKGIEYLVPFFDSVSKQLKYVAGVQVKFSSEKYISGGYKAICDTVMGLPIVEYLQEQRSVTCFPVLFSTSHGGMSRQAEEVAWGVLYNEGRALVFTQCLGPLRWHREKASEEQIRRIDLNGMRNCLNHCLSPSPQLCFLLD